jgi:hypothetical protein
MYKRIPAEINPIETSTNITYVVYFDLDFCILLRERISSSLAHIQDATFDIESNIVEYDKLRGKI